MKSDIKFYRLFQGKAPLKPESPWGVPQGNKIDNQSVFLSLWDIIVFFCCIFIAVTIPMEFGILYWSPRDISVCPITKTLSSMTIFTIAIGNLVIDVIFMIDIILNFMQGFWELRVHGAQKWYFVDDLVCVRNHYIKNGLLWDVLGQLPFQYLDCFHENMTGGLEMLHMLRLLKLLRLYRIKEAIRTLYRKFPNCRLSITAFELLLTLFLSAHWMGCVYFFVGFDEDG